MDAPDVSRVPAEVLRNVEADTYWCVSKLLDGIQVSAPPARGRPASPAPAAAEGPSPGRPAVPAPGPPGLGLGLGLAAVSRWGWGLGLGPSPPTPRSAVCHSDWHQT